MGKGKKKATVSKIVPATEVWVCGEKEEGNGFKGSASDGGVGMWGKALTRAVLLDLGKRMIGSRR